MSVSYMNLYKLYDLIQNGETRSVENFLNKHNTNLNVNLPCKGISVLHLATGIEPIDKSKKCSELLLKHGADPNICDEDFVTPVHIAAIWGRVDNLKLLIGCGGDPSKRDLDGLSAFDYAVREQQWAVYDYLHNVVDQIDDSHESKCAYSFDLEKVLVRTDQVVAEYEPVPDEKPTDNQKLRKSDMVREWCEKTSPILNKLYPTILGDSFAIDDAPPPWRSIDFNKITPFNEMLQHNTDTESNDSFKTCQSNREVKISGIHPLDITKNVCSCTSKQNLSTYENFSLKGSPQNVTHKNYNSRTCMKKCKSLNSNITNDESLFTSDDSVQIVEIQGFEISQNVENECKVASDRFSVASDRFSANTRRSSASSGVSSSFSTGNIAVGNVEEVYKYEDKEEDVVLIEKRILLSSVILPVEEPTTDTTADQSILSIASSLPSSVEYDNNTLRAELVKLGFRPGPIDGSTKTLYLKKLRSLKKNPIVKERKGKTYSIELEKSLRNTTWMSDLTLYTYLENKARLDFSDTSKKWREGTAKTSFTYLLLDPRLTDNLPSKAAKQSQHATWVDFVNAIFYVGKGKRSRPYSHLYQALTLWKRDFRTSKDMKVQHILDIWTNKLGVVCLHIFQNVIPAEAYTYEAAMIDVLNLNNLTNQKSGNYYGITASWPLKERRMLGLYLLYKAMKIFLSEGERQLRPDDID